METYLLDWLHLLLRWTHIVVGAAWIGASFYFVHLNNSLRPLKEPKKGVTGELFAIHGGGYYHVHKLDPRMETLPEPLHWFKWEAYTTWLTGAGLLVVVYYLQASAFLVGDSISPGAAIGVGVGSLVLSWLVYDGLCRTPLLTKPLLFGAVGLVLMTGAAYGLCEVLNPRAAYIHVGAMLGTMMAGNVFFTIIPRQRAMVEATLAGKEADPEDGELGAFRSLHNNYLTLPVLLVMVSNHFGALYGHRWNWALLIAVALCGAILKHWFNLHGQGKPAPIWIWFVAGLGIVAVAVVAMPEQASSTASADDRPAYAEVRGIVTERCLPCHSQWPTHPVAAAAPAGVYFDTPEELVKLADRVKAVVVDTQTMPLGNLTEMSEEERATLGAWLAAGAKLE